MIMDNDLLQVLLQVRLICACAPNLSQIRTCTRMYPMKIRASGETEYVTAEREMGPPHASGEKVHEHDGGYYVKIPECLRGERGSGIAHTQNGHVLDG